RRQRLLEQADGCVHGARRIVRLRRRSAVFMRNTPMHTRELPLKVSPWALFRVLARDERPFFIDAGRPWCSEWISSMGFRPRMQFAVRADDARGALATLDDVLASIAPSRRERARGRPGPIARGA